MSQKLLSSKVNSVRPYKSRSSRPCDFCRRRKTCCIIKDLIPCMACVGFNNGNCTFLNGPLKRTPRKADESSAKIEDGYGISSLVSASLRDANSKKKTKKTKKGKQASDIGADVSMSSSYLMSVAPAFNPVDASSPQSIHSYHTSPTINNHNDCQNGASMSQIGLLGQTLSQPHFQSSEVSMHGTMDGNQYMMQVSQEYPPSPSHSVQSEVATFNMLRSLPLRSTHDQLTQQYLQAEGFEPMTREPYLQSFSQSAPCNAPPTATSYYEPTRHIYPNDSVSLEMMSSHTPSHKIIKYDDSISSSISFDSSLLHTQSEKTSFGSHNSWPYFSQENFYASSSKITPQTMSSSSWGQQPTPKSCGPHNSMHEDAQDELFIDNSNIASSELYRDNERFHSRNHSQFQDRIQQKDFSLSSECYDSFGILNAYENHVTVESTNGVTSAKLGRATSRLLAPMYNQLYLPLDHAIPEPLFLAD